MSISPASLLSKHAYAAYRQKHHERLIAYRQARAMRLGRHAILQFEDEQTIRYQIQEMLRVEDIDDSEEMQEQIDSYSVLLPNAENWKATLMFQIPEPDLLSLFLPKFNDISHHFYLKVRGHAPVRGVANEDLDPADKRPSAVHFLRFALPASMRQMVMTGGTMLAGCDHPDYSTCVAMPAGLRDRLADDLYRCSLTGQ